MSEFGRKISKYLAEFEKQKLHAPPKDVESESTDVPSKDEEKIQNRFNHGPNSA